MSPLVNSRGCKNNGRLLLPLLFMAASACGGTEEGGHDPNDEDHSWGTMTSTTCWEEVRALFEPNIECGFVKVPESRAADGPPALEIAVVRFRAQNAGAPKPPVIWLQGGPGGESIASLEFFYPRLFSHMRRDRDVVVFDQRGIGKSIPELTCPERTDRTDDGNATWASACAKALRQKGVNMEAYNSVQNAADIDLIRTALHYEKIILYGTSYGSQLAQHYMRDFPDAVESAILDGVLPMPLGHSVYWRAELAVFNSLAIDRLLTECENDSACQTDFPNLRTQIGTIIAALETAPIRLFEASDPNNSLEMDAFDFAYLLREFTIFSRGMFWAAERIHWVYRVLTEDNTLLRGRLFRAFEFLREPDTVGDTTNLLVFFSMTCSEFDRFDENDVVIDKETRSGNIDLTRFEAKFIRTVCNNWGTTVIPEAKRRRVDSHIRTLLFTGGLDSATPPEFTDRVQQGLTNGHRVDFPNLGHVVGLSDFECPRSLILSFIQDGSQPPDTSCVPELDYSAIKSGP